jgi:hypothetical protein
MKPATAEHRRSIRNHEIPIDSAVTSAAPAQARKFSWRQNPEQENVARKNVVRFPDVTHREPRRSSPGHNRSALKSGYRRVVNGGEESTEPIEPQFTRDQRAASYGVSVDRWPALFEASPDDYFDDLMAAWRELSHNRRLDREQAGGLWSE